MAIAAAVVLAGAGVVALGLAGNGDGGTPVGSGGGRTGEPDDGSAADLTLADLEPALLTTDDVPPGYVENGDDGEDGDEGDEPLTVDDVQTDPACQDVLEQLEGAGAGEDEGALTAELERPDDNASVTHDLWLGTPR